MTNFVDEIVVHITRHRDEDPDFPFDDILNLNSLPQKGCQRIGMVTYRWEKLGGLELPSTRGGDN